MSKNVFAVPNYLNPAGKNILTLKFEGEIVVMGADFKNGCHGLILGDTEKPHTIGANIGPLPKQAIELITGETVALVFNNADSVEVVIEKLREIKARILAGQ